MAGLAGILTSMFLQFLGYSQGADLGIRAIYIFGGLILLPAILIFRKYPLTK